MHTKNCASDAASSKPVARSVSKAFIGRPADAPMPLLRLMARCWAEVPALRPDFSEVLAELQALAKVGEVGHAVN